ncbi:enoyl-CoA hydratase/isomerase family protein [Halomonas kalidii]|uniref:Enoyl-CoA hydratase/isomerase family protein n=1 Tax=Halomonas kalidii TaxID=3043293 RepID=A0ABT6VII5_9GAMM|nr:enoyl-CoA hydratase/isomerase family protein [Halomonas kalidii]MDI5933793.1 enoyl-CoA hydratase/isomerase family protein [Halomonas kalidii]
MALVETWRNGAVAGIRMNRPDRANALSAELVEALLTAINEAIDSGARILVLSGNGATFCGGFDLSTLEQENDASLMYRFLRIELLLQALYYAPLYTVALVHGAVSGAGADLAAACSRRIAAPRSSLRFPGIRFGAVLGTRRLMALVGAKARAILLEQERVDAEEALRINLIDRIAQQDEWDAIVESLECSIAAVPTESASQVMQLDIAHGDRDLGLLARSIAEPGLKQRMQEYWLAMKAERAERLPREGIVGS